MPSIDRTARDGPVAPTGRLDVYVGAHCLGCAEARRLAEAAVRQFPGLVVRVIDLEHEPAARPDLLVAVPAYFLDGRVVSLGNPRQRDLFRYVEQALAMGVDKPGSEP